MHVLIIARKEHLSRISITLFRSKANNHRKSRISDIRMFRIRRIASDSGNNTAPPDYLLLPSKVDLKLVNNIQNECLGDELCKHHRGCWYSCSTVLLSRRKYTEHAYIFLHFQGSLSQPSKETRVFSTQLLQYQI